MRITFHIGKGNTMTNQQDAAEALAAMRQARIRANTIRRLPFAYHFAFGALMAGFVAAPSLGQGFVGFASPLLILLSVVLYHWQRRATGRWLNGFRAGRTLPVTILTITALCVLIFISNPGTLPTFSLITPLQGAAIAFVLGTLLDWAWMRVYDREQSAGQ
jgi:hypothetical protein